MMNCWQNESEARPSFAALTKQLKDMENQHKVRSAGKKKNKKKNRGLFYIYYNDNVVQRVKGI